MFFPRFLWLCIVLGSIFNAASAATLTKSRAGASASAYMQAKAEQTRVIADIFKQSREASQFQQMINMQQKVDAFANADLTSPEGMYGSNAVSHDTAVRRLDAQIITAITGTKLLQRMIAAEKEIIEGAVEEKKRIEKSVLFRKSRATEALEQWKIRRVNELKASWIEQKQRDEEAALEAQAKAEEDKIKKELYDIEHQEKMATQKSEEIDKFLSGDTTNESVTIANKAKRMKKEQKKKSDQKSKQKKVKKQKKEKKVKKQKKEKKIKKQKKEKKVKKQKKEKNEEKEEVEDKPKPNKKKFSLSRAVKNLKNNKAHKVSLLQMHALKQKFSLSAQKQKVSQNMRDERTKAIM